VARTGQQVFDLTWRRDYQPVHNVGWSQFGPTAVNSQRTIHSIRYWGLDHWACRTGQGAYLNWVVGNAILPAVDRDPTHQGIQKVDRTTVPELKELVASASSLQTDLDNAEGGQCPLGIPAGGIAFDIDPTVVVGTSNGTHFEQVYGRAVVALNNAVAAFNDASSMTRLMRSEEDSLVGFEATVQHQEQAYNDQLIELYGTPYPDDMGPGQTYPQGYTGPDLIHYTYVENPDTNFFNGILPDPLTTQTFVIDAQNLPGDWWTTMYTNFDFIKLATDPSYPSNAQFSYSYTVGPNGFFDKPVNWSGHRQSPGKLQQAISSLLTAQNALRNQLSNAQQNKQILDKQIGVFLAQVAVQTIAISNQNALNDWQQTINDIQTAYAIDDKWLTDSAQALDDYRQALTDEMPSEVIFGLASGGDFLKTARIPIYAAFLGVKTALIAADDIHFTVAQKQSQALQHKIFALQARMAANQFDQDLQNGVLALGAQLLELQNDLSTINQYLRNLNDAAQAYQAMVAQGDRIQQERLTFRQHAAAVVQGYRTRDAAFIIFRNEKLERYKTLFDLAARYALLAANAYDYETGLLNTEAGRAYVSSIINSCALGVVQSGQPQYAGSDTGDPGLSSALAEMKADWDVLRGRLGINNPDAYGTTVSLRTECLRILPTTDGEANWKDALQIARMDNVLEDQDVSRYCLQVDNGEGLPVPGLVLSFSTTIADGYNLFGRQLAAGDHAFSPSSFATKIFAVGVALEGYRGMDDPSGNNTNLWLLDPLALSATPYIYLVPVGVDSMRSPPLGDSSTIRTWTVNDVAIPMPFNIGASGFSTLTLWQSSDSLTEPLFASRKHQAFRPVSDSCYFTLDLYGDTGTLRRSQFTNNRLIGRSVWNSRWKMVIPGGTLLNDPYEGLDRFLQTVTDIKLHFVTYSYSGN
jgi:hypothetical protein